MLYIPLDRAARRTYTRQIYYALRRKILAGELAAGEALPPYRGHHAHEAPRGAGGVRRAGGRVSSGGQF